MLVVCVVVSLVTGTVEELVKSVDCDEVDLLVDSGVLVLTVDREVVMPVVGAV